MNLIDFFKKDNCMFYSDSLEVFKCIKQSLLECSDLLSDIKDENYFETFRTVRDGFDTITKIIERFIDNWVTDDDKICNTLKTIENYLEYYIRLCKTSTNYNCKENAKYMVDSIKTVTVVINMKISFIENNKIK